MFTPKTRRERVLVRAAQLLAEQCNAGLVDLLVNVAIAQADGEFSEAEPIDVRVDYHYRWKEPV